MKASAAHLFPTSRASRASPLPRAARLDRLAPWSLRTVRHEELADVGGHGDGRDDAVDLHDVYGEEGARLMVTVDIFTVLLLAAAGGGFLLGRYAIRLLLLTVLRTSWWKIAWTSSLYYVYYLLLGALALFIGVSGDWADKHGRQILLSLIPALGPVVRGGATMALSQTAVIIAVIGLVATIAYVQETRRMRVLQERLVRAQESAAATDSATMARIADALDRLAPPPSKLPSNGTAPPDSVPPEGPGRRLSPWAPRYPGAPGTRTPPVLLVTPYPPNTRKSPP